MTPSFSHREDVVWLQELSTCLYGEDLSTRTITIEPGRVLRFLIHQTNDLYADMYVYGSVDPANHTGYYLTKRAMPLLHHFATPLASGADLSDYLTTDEKQKLLHSESCFVVLSNGICIPLQRTGAFSGIADATQPDIYYASGLFGMYTNANLTELTRMNISNTGVITAVKLKFSDGTVTDLDNVQAVGIY